jgi:hypothetical protein
MPEPWMAMQKVRHGRRLQELTFSQGFFFLQKKNSFNHIFLFPIAVFCFFAFFSSPVAWNIRDFVVQFYNTAILIMTKMSRLD